MDDAEGHALLARLNSDEAATELFAHVGCGEPRSALKHLRSLAGPWQGDRFCATCGQVL